MCIVDAFLFEYFDRTLAALPVGARRTDLLPIHGSDFTKEEINVVFPVPAYPFKTNIFLFPRVRINSSKSKNVLDC